MIALPAGIFLFTAHQVSRSGMTHSLTHSEHLHGKPHRLRDHAANECDPAVDAINISVDRAGG